MLKRRKSSDIRSRLKMLRNLQPGRSPTESPNRPLVFEEDNDEITIPAPAARTAPRTVTETPRPTKRKNSRDDDFLQDNLTNANLDLARAYINMGERASAKPLLDEVASTGTDAEKIQARKLLQEIQ